MNQKILLRAKSLLNHTTPLARDCGRLCGHRCCHGSDDTGMELLPGEYEADRLWLYGEMRDHIFICKGRCERSHRPYACMIFPLFPLLSQKENGNIAIRAQLDIRASSLCPLTNNQLRADFIRAVRRSALILSEDPEYRSYLFQLSTDIQDAQYLKELIY